MKISIVILLIINVLILIGISLNAYELKERNEKLQRENTILKGQMEDVMQVCGY